MKKIKTIIFDIDGTLTDNHSWIDTTIGFGADPNPHKDLYQKFKNKEITLEESKKRLIELWNSTGNANKVFWLNLCSTWQLKPDARKIVNYLKQKGYIVALISGGFDIYVENIAKRLDIEEWHSTSKLFWNNEGKLYDFEYDLDGAGQKYKKFELIKQKYSINDNEAAIVGDGDNDLVLFQKLGMSVAVNPYDKVLKPYLKHEISALSQLQQIF